MKFYFVLSLFLIVTSLIACVKSSPQLRADRSSTDTLSTKQDTLITLERTVCYGRCPAYRLQIYADGTTMFEGIQSTKHKGLAKSRISREKIDTLIQAFDYAKFFSLKNDYEYGEDCKEHWTDFPSVIISIKLGNKSKKVNHYHGCKGFTLEKELYKLEEEIDRVVDTAQWIK